MATYIATQKFVKMTPRKLRLVADAVRGMAPAQAIEVLPYSARFAAKPLMKVIQTAVANARVQGADETKLIFSEVVISQGPALKRGLPVSRGQWHPIKKRMSHIRVVLTEKAAPAKKEKKVKAPEAQASAEVVKPAAKKTATKKTNK